MGAIIGSYVAHMRTVYDTINPGTHTHTQRIKGQKIPIVLSHAPELLECLLVGAKMPASKATYQPTLTYHTSCYAEKLLTLLPCQSSHFQWESSRCTDMYRLFCMISWHLRKSPVPLKSEFPGSGNLCSGLQSGLKRTHTPQAGQNSPKVVSKLLPVTLSGGKYWQTETAKQHLYRIHVDSRRHRGKFFLYFFIQRKAVRVFWRRSKADPLNSQGGLPSILHSIAVLVPSQCLAVVFFNKNWCQAYQGYADSNSRTQASVIDKRIWQSKNVLGWRSTSHDDMSVFSQWDRVMLKPVMRFRRANLWDETI